MIIFHHMDRTFFKEKQETTHTHTTTTEPLHNNKPLNLSFTAVVSMSLRKDTLIYGWTDFTDEF